jgi:2-aminoadipate transaminase
VIDLVAKTLIDPGDVVIAEGPTYPGAVPVFSSYQAEVVQVEMDADGMRVDLLEESLDRLERDGRRPKFVYTVPSFHNPAGVTLSLPRRRRLVEVARERELLVLEDNPYGLLRYEGAPNPPLYALDGGVYVMYLGTFSKILSPGIRLGWVVAPPPVLEKINLGKQAADLCTSTLSQLMVQAYFEQARWRAYVGATPCSTRSRSTSPLRRSGPVRAAASSSGSRCPTSSTRPTCSRGRCARTSPSCRAWRPTSTAAAAARCG